MFGKPELNFKIFFKKFQEQTRHHFRRLYFLLFLMMTVNICLILLYLTFVTSAIKKYMFCNKMYPHLFAQRENKCRKSNYFLCREISLTFLIVFIIEGNKVSIGKLAEPCSVTKF